MVSVEKARIELEKLFGTLGTEKVSLMASISRCISENVIAHYQVPGFDNSAMDGYAISLQNWDRKSPFKIIGESAAGDNVSVHLNVGEAMRIFTGAMVPQGADAVVMQEKAERKTDQVWILDENIGQGINIRKAGSQTKVGSVVLSKFTPINAGTIGFLASVGIAELQVFNKPKISIIVTGKEVVQPGFPIQPGQVFECNSFGLQAALSVIGIESKIAICGDALELISNAIETALLESDILIITGGISVGDYDFVLPALKENGVVELFYKVKQKPAKPLFVGKKGKIPVFGLPGNPASVLTSFHVYVAPVIRAILGDLSPFQGQISLLDQAYSKKAGMTHFVKGFYEQGRVEILGGQESYRMDAFAKANCLIEFAENEELFLKDSAVKIIPI